MTQVFDQARLAWNRVADPVRRWPLLHHSLHLTFALAAYVAGILAVDTLTGDARLPVLLFIVFFLPGVLRPWLNLYWQVRRDLRELRRRHRSDAGAH